METYNNDRANQPVLAVRIIAVKPFTKNTLRGFLDFELTDMGIVIHGATIHEKGNSRWLSMPCKEWDKDGKHCWAAIVEVPDKRDRARLQRAIFAALDAYQARESAKSTPLHDSVVAAYDARDMRSARGGR